MESPRRFSAATSGTPNEPVLFTSVFPSLPYTSFIFFHLRMSVSREPSEELESHFKTTLIASLTIYNSAQKSKYKFKAANKSVKVKEIDFTITEDNYLQILREISNSHSQEKYKVTVRWHYGFKYIPLALIRTEENGHW